MATDPAPHAPFFERLRRRGRDPAPFKRPAIRGWVALALVALVLTAILPLLVPASRPWLARSTPALSLFFMLAAVGWWLRMEHRAFTVAAAFTLLLYGGTAWIPFAYQVDDFTIIALISSFGVFALAGFNLVFILEEMVFDAHRELHVSYTAWAFAPSLLVLGLAVGLGVTRTFGNVPTLWITCVVWSILMLAWWTFRAFNTVHGNLVLRELHMLLIGTVAATGLVDVVRLAGNDVSVLPSVVMYVILVGTWIYVSYTTLQRTHFLLRADKAVPWLCILLSASFALLQHASLHFQVEGAYAVTNLLRLRVAYLIFGMWAGLGFYVMQSMWRVLRALRDDRSLAPRTRIVAGSLARLAESLLGTERRLEGAAVSLYHGMDRILPGRHHDASLPASWDVGPEGVERVEEE